MTYFATAWSTKRISNKLEIPVTSRGKARMMLHIEAGHSTNCQIMLKLLGLTYFAII